MFCLLFAGIGSSVQAQVVGGTNEKLMDFYVMGKYEDCAWRAEKLTQNDKYRRDPEPYLYVAMSFYQIHMNKEEYDEELYKDPLKDAMKYAAKFRKKDKDTTMYMDNTEFFIELRRESLSAGRFFFKDANYRKAASLFKRIAKFVPEDHLVLYMTGMYSMLSRNVGEGALQIKTAREGIEKDLAAGTFEIDDDIAEDLLDTIIAYSDFLAETQDDRPGAIETIEFAQKLIPDNVKLRNQKVKLEG